MKKLIVEPTPFGPVALLWSELDGVPKIVRVLLSKPRSTASAQAAALYPQARTGSCREIDEIAEAIRAFLTGRPVAFPLEAATLAARPAFQ